MLQRFRDEQEVVTRLFNKRLDRDYHHDLPAVGLIEALLFLSMVPLHKDFLSRQLVMLATGIEKIDTVLKAAQAGVNLAAASLGSSMRSAAIWRASS